MAIKHSPRPTTTTQQTSAATANARRDAQLERRLLREYRQLPDNLRPIVHVAAHMLRGGASRELTDAVVFTLADAWNNDKVAPAPTTDRPKRITRAPFDLACDYLHDQAPEARR